MPNMQILFPVLLIGVFYFFIIRPQMREKKAFEKLLQGLKKGDKVVTNSGIFGEVTAIKDDTRVTLKVADSVKIDFLKSSVTKILD
jgi:preprotein translocase subunit YajC